MFNTYFFINPDKIFCFFLIIYFFIPLFFYSFNHLFLHSIIYFFISSFISSFHHSFLLTIIYFFIPSFISSFHHSFLHKFIYFFNPSFISSFFSSFHHSYLRSIFAIIPLFNCYFTINVERSVHFCDTEK